MVDQTQVPTKNLIYEKVRCDFGKPRMMTENLGNKDHTLSHDDESFELVLNGPGYTDLRKGMYVDVFDMVGFTVTQGSYRIVSIDYVKNILGEVDNVFVGLNAIDDGTY